MFINKGNTPKLSGKFTKVKPNFPSIQKLSERNKAKVDLGYWVLFILPIDNYNIQITYIRINT